MALKLFLDHILLLKNYGFKGFSNQFKNDGMVKVIQTAVTSSDFKKSSNIAKDY